MSACSKDEEEPKQILSGAKSALWAVHLLSDEAAIKTPRPSATLGIFVSAYLAGGSFLPIEAALKGIDAQMALYKTQKDASSGDTFLLLQEIGGMLQVDLVDALNRSDDRAETLNEYLESLKNTSSLAERKHKELSVQHKEYESEKASQKKIVRDLERTVNKAYKAQEYAEAGRAEELLVEEEAALAELSTKEKQSKDIVKRYEEILKIAALRVDAIQKNREILVSGLRVINVPGIEDFRILEKGQKWNPKRDDIFGGTGT